MWSSLSHPCRYQVWGMISDMIKYLYISVYLQYSNVVSFKVAKEGGYVMSKCEGKGWMTCSELKDAFEKKCNKHQCLK